MKRRPRGSTCRARWVALAMALVGCRPTSQPVPRTVSTDEPVSAPVRTASTEGSGSPITRLLPDRAAPFVAVTPVLRGDGFLRRTYAAGDRRVEITVARMGREPGAFASWTAGARNYPPVALPVPADQASGFFTCASEDTHAACDFHIQFHSGFHLEGMGNGRVPKSDLGELVAHLPIAVLTDPALSLM